MQLHICVLHEDQIPDIVLQEFEESIRAPGLIFERETRSSGAAFAGVEWLMPTVVLAYVAKPYFESFLKEMGKVSIRMNSASNSYFKTSMPSHLKAITITHFKSATHSRGDAATQL